MDPAWRDFVRASALITLALMRQFLPGIAPDWFFHVLATHDQALADRIRQQPVIFGLWVKAKRWLLIGLGCIAAIGVCILAAPVVGAALAPVAVAVIAAG